MNHFHHSIVDLLVKSVQGGKFGEVNELMEILAPELYQNDLTMGIADIVTSSFRAMGVTPSGVIGHSIGTHCARLAMCAYIVGKYVGGEAGAQEPAFMKPNPTQTIDYEGLVKKLKENIGNPGYLQETIGNEVDTQIEQILAICIKSTLDEFGVQPPLRQIFVRPLQYLTAASYILGKEVGREIGVRQR